MNQIELLSCWYEGVFYVEEFKPVPGYEGLYEASSFGRYKSVSREVVHHRSGKRIVFNIGTRILKQAPDKAGYPGVTLSKNGRLKTFRCHRFVAELFIPNPEGKATVNHKFGVKGDNRFFVLEWNTQAENNQHAFTSGLNKRIRMTVRNESLRINQFTIDGTFVKEWGSQSEIQRQTEYKQTCISACVRGKNKSSYGFIWKRG